MPVREPIPTTRRQCPPTCVRNTFAPDPSTSHWVRSSGFAPHVTLGGRPPQATCQASVPATRCDQRRAPVWRSSATTDEKRSSAGKQLSLQRVIRSGGSPLISVAPRHAATEAGTLFWLFVPT